MGSPSMVKVVNTADADAPFCTWSDRQRIAGAMSIELDDLNARIKEIEEIRDVRESVAHTQGRVADRRSGSGEFDDARRVLDGEFRSGRLPAHAAESATDLLTEGPKESRTKADRWVRAAGNVEYRGAFAKLLADPDRGHLLWTGAESDAC